MYQLTYGKHSQATGTNMPDSSESMGIPNQVKENPRSKARFEFMQKVSIPGLLDVHYAYNSIITAIWYLTYVLSIASVVYHIVLLVQQYQDQKPTYEYVQTDKKLIPFPKVTVCAPTGANKTWMNEHIQIPWREKKKLENMSKEEQDDFMDSIAGLFTLTNEYFSSTGQFDPKDPLYFSYIHVLEETTKKLPNESLELANFNGAVPGCQSVLSNCRLGNEEFECCENVKLELDHYGGCFDLQISQIDDGIYRKQSMSPLSLTFDTSMDWAHMTKRWSMNGFFIHLTGPGYGIIGRPITVPAGMHVLITLTQPTWRIHKTNCVNRMSSGTAFGTYDSLDTKCMNGISRELERKYVGCEIHYADYLPNDTVQCTGGTWLPVKIIYLNGVSRKDDLNSIKHEQRVRQDIASVFKICPPSCEAWEFQARHSYSELLRSDYTSPDGQHSKSNISKSRVTIMLTSDYYIERTESDLKPFYSTFVSMAYVIGLYLGCSMITLAEILFYGAGVVWTYWKTRHTVNPVACSDAE